MSDNEPFIAIPSRQGQLNDQTDFTLDPSLIFDELPQPFRCVKNQKIFNKFIFVFQISRRINKILELIFHDAWTIIEQREKQRITEQSKFVSAQHTSSTIINVK